MIEEDHHRRWYDAGDSVKILVGTIIVTTFIILGVLAFAIVNIGNTVRGTTGNLYDGIICILEQFEENADRDKPRDLDHISQVCVSFLEGAEDNSVIENGV